MEAERNPAADQPTHIDDWVSTPFAKDDAEAYAQWVLMHMRLPAVMKWKFAKFWQHHLLFATYEGKRYRVTGASRMGDVWLAEDFKRDTGYDLRVMLDNCSAWGKGP